MDVITNVNVGTGDIHPIVLATFGVASCFAVIIELENKVFIHHTSPEHFKTSSACSIDDAHNFLMMIFKNVYDLDMCAIIKTVFIIRRWNDMYYIALRKQIDLIRNHCKIKMKQNNSSSPNNFEFFISKIMLNLIDFNMPVKKSNGKNKETGDDDSPNNYVVDATIIYDRSSNPHTFIIGQYGGREHQMGTNRNDSLLQVIYEFNAILKNFRAFICANARESPYYTDLLNQVLLNVNSQSYIYDSFHDDNFKTKIDTLLSQVEKTTILYE